MRRHSFWKWGVIWLIGLTAWLLPLAGVLWRLRAREVKAKPVPLPAQAARPLILYTDGWPTRAKLNLDEIQGATEVSAGSLAPKTIASDLQRELADLGITTEPRRFESLPPDFDPGSYRPIVLVYSVRHRQAAPEVIQFIDRHVEPWVGRHGSGKAIALTDVAISENAGDAQGARQAIAGAARYYEAAYRPGPELHESIQWIKQEELIRAQAHEIRAALATP